MSETMPQQGQEQQPGHEHEMHPEPDYMPRFPAPAGLKARSR